MFRLTDFLLLCLFCQQVVTSFNLAPNQQAHIARLGYLRNSGSQFMRRSHILCGASGDLDRELDKFFELAAESGYENIKNMTPEERVERVIRGEQLENEIFDLRSDLMQLEDDMMAGKIGVDIEAAREMRKRMDSLKAEYKDIVGAKDLPLYFGRLADSLQ